jgi:hypothetical protein
MDNTKQQECILIDIEAYRKKYLPARFSINSIFILIGEFVEQSLNSTEKTINFFLLKNPRLNADHKPG